MISSCEPGHAGDPLGAQRGGWLRCGRWLLPWLATSLASASLAWAMTSALTGAWVPVAARSASSSTPLVAELPPAGAASDGDDARALDLVCISRSAAYNASMSDAVRRCSILVVQDPAPMSAMNPGVDLSTGTRAGASAITPSEGTLEPQHTRAEE